MNAPSLLDGPALQACSLHTLARRASFLWERAAPPTAGNTGSRHADPAVLRRLARWAQVLHPLGEPGDAALRKRLAWDGLDPARIAPCLAGAAEPAAGALPAWTRTVAAISEAARAWHAQGGALRWQAALGLPFEPLFEPMRLLARQRLAARLARRGTAALDDWLAADCAAQLEAALLRRLASTAAPTLQHEFTADLSFGEQLLQRLGTPTAAPATQRFQRFVAAALADGCTTLFDRYPVLARLLATAVDFWVETSAGLVERLAADHALLEATFAPPGQPLGRVTALQTSLSDAHRGGESTAVLTFEGKVTLLYKPKSLALDVAYNRLLAWCNAQGAPLDLQVTRTMDCGDHGYCEFVAHRPCADAAAVARFYRRAGMLACLLHLLRGTDTHFENLIADGEHPVLIDTETLLHPDPAPLDGAAATADSASMALLQHSVLRTGMLPRWDFSGDRRTAFDISGLADLSREEAFARAATWHAVNTDAMHVRVAPAAAPAAANTPHCDLAQTCPDDHHADVLGGFEAMHAYLQSRREQLRADGGPLAALRGLPVRYVFRPTRHYVAILQHALQPASLRDGADFSIEIERLAVGYLTAQERPAAWSQLRAEQQALGQLDVPFFHTRTDSRRLHGQPDLTLPDYFRASGWSDLQGQLERWNEAGLALQKSIMRGCFEARLARGTDRGSASGDDGVAAEAPAAPEPAETAPAVDAPVVGDWIDAAAAIATELMARGVETGCGERAWLGLHYVHEADRYQLEVAGDGLYDGHVGIALFLAALHTVKGDDLLRLQVGQVLDGLVRRLAAHRGRPALLHESAGIGGGSGSGGIIYGLTRIAGFLQQPAWLDLATALAHSMSPAVIAHDRSLDVIGGAAGALLGLLALHRATGDPVVLDRAIACGHHLLAARSGAPDQPRAWAVGPQGRRHTGFAHGAAGICLALMRLHSATGERAWRRAAREGMAFERRLFDASPGLWPGAEGDVEERVQWCRGAPGIALARVGVLDESVTPQEWDQNSEEITAAIETTLRARTASRDHLCCGTSGRVEALLVAAESLARPDWAAAARQAAAAMLVQARQAGAYRLAARTGAPLFNPGLYQGTAGIGYQWLRLACPTLPSVLLWQ